MGKIRIKTLGEEERERKEKQKAKARAEAKKAQKNAEETAMKPQQGAESAPKAQEKPAGEHAEVAPSEEKKQPAKKAKFDKKRQKHSAKYTTVAQLVDKNKLYNLDQALELLPKLKRAKFDETVELHINTVDKGISGNMTLPHGTGKQTKVAIANFSENPKQVEDLVKNIEAGKIEFDILIATPETMPKLAKVARVLGPRGLMPNPKNGTVSKNPEEIAKKYQGGQVNFKTEAKFPLLHLSVGKVSFGEKKLADNIKSAVVAVQMKNIKTVSLKSTMSPAVRLDITSF